MRGNMALIACPGCGAEVSDSAFKCVKCGYRLKEEAVPVNSVETFADRVDKAFGTLSDGRAFIEAINLKYILQGYIGGWRNCFGFGRTRRREYWGWFIGNGALVIFACLVRTLLFAYDMRLETAGTTTQGAIDFITKVETVVGVAYLIAAAIPTFTITIRRIHDIGWTGWALVLGLLVNPFLAAFFYLGGEPGENSYGRDPKDPNSLPVTDDALD